jgi:hypothetical protein
MLCAQGIFHGVRTKKQIGHILPTGIRDMGAIEGGDAM